MPKRKAVEVLEDETEEQRYFLNPDSVSKHLYCSICQEVFVEPQRAPCGHSYCKRCINAWLDNSRTCPEDRKPLKKSDLHHDFILENIIGDQMVACSFRRSGCEFVGQLQTLSSHKKSCSFNPTNLPEFLRQDALDSSLHDDGSVFTETEDDEVPEVVKPSLKMRLFTAGGDQRDLLCSMFDGNKEERPSTSSRTGRGKSARTK